jgi:hypothetical protein
MPEAEKQALHPKEQGRLDWSLFSFQVTFPRISDRAIMPKSIRQAANEPMRRRAWPLSGLICSIVWRSKS